MTQPVEFKSENGIGLSSSINVTGQSLVQQQCEVRADVRVTIDALDYGYNHDTCIAVGGRALGPGGQEEQRTQRAFFVATYHTKMNRSSSGRSTSSSLWARMLG